MVPNAKKQTVLITGGSGGLGLAIAKKLHSSAYAVTLTDLIKPNSSLPFFQCDIRNARQIQQLYSWTMEHLGVPNILIIAAGVGIKEKLSEGDPEKWQQVFDVNVVGALRCIRAFLPQMLTQQHAHVIFISSVAAFQPFPYGGVYSASKTALEIIAETLRLETPLHLAVTTLALGAVHTPFFKNQLAGSNVKDEENPMLSPDKIADEILHCIENSKYGRINKITIRPDQQYF